jgi:hypothetical protein
MVVSDGMTLEKVTAVGKSGFLTGTPATATAALGTARGLGVGRAEEWAAGRKRKKEEGGSKGRKRGRGAQLRRQMVKQEKAFREWRAARGDEGDRLQMMQPGVTRAESQRHGCTRLLMQLTKVKMELAKAGRQTAAAEVKVGVMREELEVLNRWYDGQEATDLRRVQYSLHEEKMKVKGERRQRDEAVAELRSLWAVKTANEDLWDEERKRLEVRVGAATTLRAMLKEALTKMDAERQQWQAERSGLAQELKEAREVVEQEEELYGTRTSRSGGAKASPGTTRKAVEGPTATGAKLEPRQLGMDAAVPAEKELEPPPPPPPPLPPPSRWVTCLLPAGYVEGQRIRVDWQGRQVFVDAPPGMLPGQRLKVELPGVDVSGQVVHWKDSSEAE